MKGVVYYVHFLSRSPSSVWIAPEVQNIMESSKKETLLPSNIMKEM